MEVCFWLSDCKLEWAQTRLVSHKVCVSSEFYILWCIYILHQCICFSFFQVTVDVAWSPDCIDLRCYDNRGLAENTDFLFVMAYDEQSQIFGDKCVGLANSDFYKTLQGESESGTCVSTLIGSLSKALLGCQSLQTYKWLKRTPI